MTIEDCFQVLELTVAASPDQVRRAYKRLAVRWHPDRFPAGSSDHREAEERLKRINASYDRLKRYFENGRSEPRPQRTRPSSSGSSQSTGNNRHSDRASEERRKAPPVDFDCVSFRGDPRLNLSFIQRVKYQYLRRRYFRHLVRIDPEAIVLAYVDKRDVLATSVNLDDTILGVEHRGRFWSATKEQPGKNTKRRRWLPSRRTIVVWVGDSKQSDDAARIQVLLKEYESPEQFVTLVRSYFCPHDVTVQTGWMRVAQFIEVGQRLVVENRYFRWGVIGLVGLMVGAALVGKLGDLLTRWSTVAEFDEVRRERSSSDVELFPNAKIRKGSFTVWPTSWTATTTDREGKHATERVYAIAIELLVSEDLDQYRLDDLSGSVQNESNDRRSIPDCLETAADDGQGNVRVRNGRLTFMIRCPSPDAPESLYRLEIRSKSLDEAHTFHVPLSPVERRTSMSNDER